eukprot:354017-Chlamydomonas_euryale.AAC.1
MGITRKLLEGYELLILMPHLPHTYAPGGAAGLVARGRACRGGAQPPFGRCAPRPAARGARVPRGRRRGAGLPAADGASALCSRAAAAAAASRRARRARRATGAGPQLQRRV